MSAKTKKSSEPVESAAVALPGFLFAAFLLFAAAIAAMWFENLPLLGDDRFYADDLARRGGGLKALPRLMAAVFTGCNGRIGDMTGTLWYAVIPRGISGVVAGLLTFALPLVIRRLGGFGARSVMGSAVIVAATVWLLPWWDMTRLVCMINYPWGAALGLACLMPLFDKSGMKSRRWWWGLPVAFAGAGWHEAFGLPLAFSLAVWTLGARRSIVWSPVKRAWLAALIFGGLFTVASPALYARIGEVREPDAPMWNLLLTSASIPCILAVALLVVAVARRALLRTMIRDGVFDVMTLSAFASTAIVLVGGVEGRSGMFAQCFALVALCRLWLLSGLRLPLGPAVRAWLASAVYVVAAWWTLTSWQRERRTFDVMNAAIEVYPRDHNTGYMLLLSSPRCDLWDAASLKTLDPSYDDKKDRNADLWLRSEAQQ